jgi:hypothetical protein
MASRPENLKTTIYKIRSLHPQQHIILSLLIIFIVISLPARVASPYLAQNAMAVGPAATSPLCITNSTKPQPLSTTSNQTLSVRGTIDLTNSTIKLDPFMVLPGSKYTSQPTNSSFSINLLDSKGKTLARYPFDPKVYTYGSSQNIDKMALLSEAVPYILCTKEIVISKDNRELASRYVDNYAPKVKIIFPTGGETLTGNITVRWEATDEDSNNLTYSVLYSTDSGRSWQTVASDIKDTHLTVNAAGLPGSNLSLFRIIATDGVNTGISDSNSTFNIPSTKSVG